MPSPATPRRASNRAGHGKSAAPSKQKPAHTGQPLGAHDNNTVRSRVLKWQEQGGGVVAANAPCYQDNDDENSPTESTPKPPKNKRESVPVPRSQTRKRSHSTPRKRVISDEHWKLSRSTTQSHTPPPQLPTPKRIGEYTTNDEFATPRAARNDARSTEKLRPSYGDDRNKERAGRERRKSKPPPRDFSDAEDINDETSSLFTRSAPATKSVATEDPEWADHSKGHSRPWDDDIDWAVSDADFSELSKRRAGCAPQRPRGLQKPPKGGIFTHMLDESRKMFARPEPDSPKPVQPLHNRGTKIESWLSDTPDPFLDDVDPDIDVPAPLNTRTNRAKRHHRREDGQDRDPESEQPPDDDRRRSHKSRRRTREREHSLEREAEKGSKEKKQPRERGLFIVSPPEGSPSREVKHDNSLGQPKDDGIRVTPQERIEASDTENHPQSDGSEVSGDNPPVPLNHKRPFPTTGFHQLSTIPSVETLSARDEKPSQEPAQNAATENHVDSHNNSNSEERDHFDSESVPTFVSQLRRRLTTHDDLISVLSSSNNRSRSIRSARSIRTNRSRLTKATVSDLLREMSADETKYMRELKTLVGGVIPVLLTCVLSKSDSAIAAGLFRPSTDPKDEVNFSKPIVDMGVAIERLKAMHKRIPHDNADSLLQWAQGAQRVYRQYLRSWRLGFKDVVVNLAPLEEGEEDDTETKSLDEGLGRDENGDVVDSDGEKVDVAYLLKRPLVRLKYLAKTFKGINILEPSPKAGETAEAYQGLVTDARRRARDERARLEDESASRIDATRSRDPMTLGLLTGVAIDKSRRVRARDFFNLTLYHSSGQVIDCRAELLLRDNAAGNNSGGDLLICEIDHSDRWLLFPPMTTGCVSARNGDRKGEIVVMLRNAPEEADVWQELLSLQIDEEEVGFEWVQLLGLDPVPPAICRSPSFIERTRQRQRNKDDTGGNAVVQVPPSPREVDVPIGEKSALRAARCSQTPKDTSSNPSTVGSSVTESKISSAITPESDYTASKRESQSKPPQPQPQILHSRNPGGDEKSPTGLKRSPAKRISRYGEGSSPGGSPPKQAPVDTGSAPSSTPGRYYEGNQQIDQSPGSVRDPKHVENQPPPKTPVGEAQPSPRLSTTPSMDLPVIPRIRERSSQSCISPYLDSESAEENMPFDSLVDEPESPSSDTGYSHSASDTNETDAEELPPPPPPHRTPSSAGSGPMSNTPVLSPGANLRRRGSSPLKHEYEPSTESDSYSDSDTSTVRHYDMESESETSATDTSDDEAEDEFIPPVETREPPKPDIRQHAHTSSATSSLSPSNSASQGGYRSVPAQPSKSTKAIASVFAWSDRGCWDNLFPGEGSVLVSPGLIEAYETSTVDLDPHGATSGGDSKGRRPMIALELTPLVPIRRGTAIDISIRSPPAKQSKINSSNNIMFRSRNPEDCEVLYGLINEARINNPTYIALQNARGPFAEEPPEFEPSDKTSRWFGWPRRRKSYRASTRPGSVADNSESSVGTMSSAFSALKRFGAGSKMFSIARSTVTSRSGQKDGGSSAGSGSNRFQSSGISRIAAAIKGSDGIGLSNAKIRLYARETQTKWRDMGAARLTILPAPSDTKRPGTSASGRSDGSGGASAASGLRDTSPPAPVSDNTLPHRSGMNTQKRILIRGKTRNEVLLDVCLGESSFERVARTGIAVSVWEENEGGAVAKQGGVGRGSFRIYMIQMKSEAEASYTFGLVGKLRY